MLILALFKVYKVFRCLLFKLSIQDTTVYRKQSANRMWFHQAFMDNSVQATHEATVK